MTVTNSLYKFNGGTRAYADQANSCNSFILNNMLNYAIDGATITNQNKIKTDTFISDTAQYLEFMLYNPGTDLYECIDTSGYFVIIGATTVTTANFAVNNCIASPVGSGGNQWILYCTVGTAQVRRAQVLRTLFEPITKTDGTTARVKSSITGLTALKVPYANDVGKQAQWAYLSSVLSSGGGGYGRYTGTFTNVVSNTNCSSWSRVDAASASVQAQWEIPQGTVVNTITNGTSDEFGTDTSVENTNNPANCEIQVSTTGTPTGSVNYSLIIANSDITWVNTADAGISNVVYNYDFKADGVVPDFTATTENDLICRLVTGSTTITGTDNVVIMRAIYTLVGADTIASEVTFNNGSNWLFITPSIITKLTNLGTIMRFRFTITRAVNTTASSITAYAAYYS